CALAALVLLLLAATGAAFQLGWDIWYARLGMGWPLGGFSPVPRQTAGLVRVVTAALLPWGAALAVCRGRRLLPLAMALTAAALAFASLASALAFAPETELDPPAV